MPTCLGLLKEWYGIRRELEDWWLLPPNTSSSNAVHYWKDKTIDQVLQSRSNNWNADQYFGYCSKPGTEGYLRLIEPDEPKSE